MSTTEFQTAAVEAIIDTFDALYKSPRFSDPEVLKELGTSYSYLEQLTKAPDVPEGQPNGIAAQVFLDNLSKGVNDIIEAADHRILVSGKGLHELSCDTCGKLIRAHAGYDKLLNDIYDLEAIDALLGAEKVRG